MKEVSGSGMRRPACVVDRQERRVEFVVGFRPLLAAVAKVLKCPGTDLTPRARFC